MMDRMTTRMTVRGSMVGMLMVGMLLSLGAPAVLAQEGEALGEELFTEYCARCHGADASGLAGYQGSVDEFNERLEGVTENMPDFAGFFEADEIESMHAFLMATVGAGE